MTSIGCPSKRGGTEPPCRWTLESKDRGLCWRTIAARPLRARIVGPGIDPLVAVDRRLEAGQDLGQALADVQVVHVDPRLADDGRELGHDRQVALERLNGDAAWARRPADVTTRSPFSAPGAPTCTASANDPIPLRMKSRRDHRRPAGGTDPSTGSFRRTRTVARERRPVAARVARLQLEAVAALADASALHRDLADARREPRAATSSRPRFDVAGGRGSSRSPAPTAEAQLRAVAPRRASALEMAGAVRSAPAAPPAPASPRRSPAASASCPTGPAASRRRRGSGSGSAPPARGRRRLRRLAGDDDLPGHRRVHLAAVRVRPGLVERVSERAGLDRRCDHPARSSSGPRPGGRSDDVVGNAARRPRARRPCRPSRRSRRVGSKVLFACTATGTSAARCCGARHAHARRACCRMTRPATPSRTPRRLISCLKRSPILPPCTIRFSLVAFAVEREKVSVSPTKVAVSLVPTRRCQHLALSNGLETLLSLNAQKPLTNSSHARSTLRGAPRKAARENRGRAQGMEAVGSGWSGIARRCAPALAVAGRRRSRRRRGAGRAAGREHLQHHRHHDRGHPRQLPRSAAAGLAAGRGDAAVADRRRPAGRRRRRRPAPDAGHEWQRTEPR